MSKRRIDESCASKKKNIDEETQKLYTTSNEWPIYNHPEGGIIKITPWGSIRQFELNGELITKFEDMAFNDYDFRDLEAKTLTNAASNGSLNSGLGSNIGGAAGDMHNHREQQYGDLPQTPQSISSIRLSPSDEAELYVMKGYEGSGFPDQYAREPEHYFGMGDEEYSDEMVM